MSGKLVVASNKAVFVGTATAAARYVIIYHIFSVSL